MELVVMVCVLDRLASLLKGQNHNIFKFNCISVNVGCMVNLMCSNIYICTTNQCRPINRFQVILTIVAYIYSHIPHACSCFEYYSCLF